MEIAEGQGVTPKALLDRPQLLPGSDFYMTAYQELQTERSIGMALGPIPWSSIVSYAKSSGITDEDDIQDFLTIIRALERAADRFDNRKDAR